MDMRKGCLEPKARMVKFTQLPHAILLYVGRELVREHQCTKDALDLLPLRLLTRHFTPGISRWIFHTSKVLINQLYIDIRTPVRDPPWTMRRHFFKTMAFPWAIDSVRDLTCKSGLAGGKVSVDAMHDNLLVLQATSKTIRRLHLDADVHGLLYDSKLPQLLPKTFENLQVLVLNYSFFFLLFSILDSAPRLHSLCLQGGRRVPFNFGRPIEMLEQEEDHQTRPERSALCVLRLDDSLYLDYDLLLGSRLRAKDLQFKLGVKLILPHRGDVGDFLINGVLAGISDWPVYVGCEKITFLNSALEGGRLVIPRPLPQ